MANGILHFTNVYRWWLWVTQHRYLIRPAPQHHHQTTSLSCSFGLPRVPFVNCCQYMYLVVSLLDLRAGCGIWLSQFLIIAYLFTFQIQFEILLVYCKENCQWNPTRNSLHSTKRGEINANKKQQHFLGMKIWYFTSYIFESATYPYRSFIHLSIWCIKNA